MLAILKFIGRNFVTIVIICLALLVGGYLAGSVDFLRNFFFPSGAYVRTPYIIVNGMHGLGQLVTTTSEVATTDMRVEIHEGFLNAGYYSANHIAVGAIEAGIDMDALTEEDLRLENDTYHITLPAPVITSCRIEHIDQNQHSLTLLVADWDMVRQLAQYNAVVQFAEEMIEAGILQKAEYEADERIGDFVSNLTGLPTVVEFAARDGEPELPASCQPIPPSGWEKDEDGAWKRAG